MADKKNFVLYRIYYGENIVYIGRTKQPLQDRIRGHVFKKPMQRSISIDNVSKIEYAEFQTEADMNLYEIYFINLWKPALNVDDKCTDNLTVSLPSVEWRLFQTPLWEKWKSEIHKKDTEYGGLSARNHEITEELRVLRSLWKTGKISEDEYYDKRTELVKEQAKIQNAINGQKEFDIEEW